MDMMMTVKLMVLSAMLFAVTAQTGDDTFPDFSLNMPNDENICTQVISQCASRLQQDVMQSKDVCGSVKVYLNCVFKDCEQAEEIEDSIKGYLGPALDRLGYDCDLNGAQSVGTSAALLLVVFATLRNIFSGF